MNYSLADGRYVRNVERLEEFEGVSIYYAATIAARVFDYSTFGSDWTYKLGARWRVLPDVAGEARERMRSGVTTSERNDASGGAPRCRKRRQSTLTSCAS